MRLLLLCVTLWLSLPALAVVETYDFSSPANEQRYHRFIEELRCPKCQNQNLAGSNAPIAADLRRELHRMLEAGRSDREILDYMVDRYGDFVLYKPRFNAETAALWLAPGGFLLLGVIVVIGVYRHQKRRNLVETDHAPLSQSERARLRQLLDEPGGERVDD